MTRRLTQRELLARDLSEGELQKYVVELAELLGWTVRHARDSRAQNLSDLPDLFLIRPPRIVWILSDAEQLEPIPCKGALGLWEYTP